ncbi:MAG: PAS domain S-box protein [Calditrichia bacterium]|nr:PAS domain S-box protein [Calditrichota bacterium]
MKSPTALNADLAQNRDLENTEHSRLPIEYAHLESEIRFQTLIENMPDGVMIVDINDCIRFVNRRFCEMTGYSGEELLGKTAHKMLFSEKKQPIILDKLNMRKKGIADRYEITMRCKSGKELWVHISGSPIYNVQGEMFGSCGIVTDITMRKRAEVWLLESEKRFRLLFNSGNDAVFVFYPDENGMPGKFIEVNDIACRMLGFTREALMRLSLPQLIQQNNPDELLARIIKEKHVLFEETLIPNTGNTIPVEISAHLFKFNRRPAIMAIARDITARRRTEMQLREQAALLDKAQDAILLIDLNNYIVYWNKSAERLYGWKVEEALGNDGFAMLFKRNSPRFAEARQATLKKGEWHGEMRQMTKNQREIVVESRWTLVNNIRRSRSILIVNSDITERKQIEAQFLRAQRMESIGSLAGGIAHDLNNVLAPILTAVQILQVRLGEDERNLKILDTIEGNVKRGVDMVKQILAFARGVEGDRMPLQLTGLIEDVAKISRDTFPKSIDIQMDVEPELWNVSGDMTQLHQVLLNLCVNARDAMPDGGILSIGLDNLTIDDHFARTILEARPGRFVRISVSDTGVGISEALLNRIFEPFFTTKETGKGTGLGLSTVLAIVKSHEGFINVESEQLAGTTFEIYLPALIEEHFPKIENKPVDLPMGQGETILFIDDEPSVLEIAQMTLESHGYRVLAASDGAEALGIFARHKNEVDLVITDMMMPVMDGVATIEALRKIKKDVPIIASSGYIEDDRANTFVQTGAVAFLQKPYTRESLLSIIFEQLNADKTNNLQ